jgi:hypothetical protein
LFSISIGIGAAWGGRERRVFEWMRSLFCNLAFAVVAEVLCKDARIAVASHTSGRSVWIGTVSHSTWPFASILRQTHGQLKHLKATRGPREPISI